MTQFRKPKGKAYKVPTPRINNLFDCEREELEFYQQAHDLGQIRKASIGGIRFEYARMTLDADFSERAKIWIKVVGPFGMAQNFWTNLYVFTDEVKDQELEDTCGLHERLHSTVGGQVGREDEHYVVCREQIRILSKDPALFEKFSQFWYDKVKAGPHKPIRHFGVGLPLISSGGYGYFHGRMPNLERILREGKVSPVELMGMYKDVLDKEYKDVRVRLR